MSKILMVLEAATAIAHGDPGAENVGNTTPFRTQDVLYRRPGAATPIADETEPVGLEESVMTRNLREAEAAIRALAAYYPLSPALAAALSGLEAEEFLASAFLFTLIQAMNRLHGGEGEGLFSGTERYDLLQSRLKIVGSQFATSIFSVYARLLSVLRIESILPLQDILPAYTSLPRAVQQAMIATLTRDSQACITIARYWFDETRKQREAPGEGLWQQFYDPAGKIAGSSLVEAEAAVPHISTNAFRHSIFRETLRDHLLEVCGIGTIEEVVREKRLPEYVTMLFSNGSNVAAGKPIPANNEELGYYVQRMFPSIELLGGCTPTLIMTGKLVPSNWTLCLQNNQATSYYGQTSDVDAASLLTVITNVTHAVEGMEATRANSQMIFSHTVMKQGSKVLLLVGFRPYTSERAKGAAWLGLQRWLQAGGHVGGKDAQGEGHFHVVETQILPDAPGDTEDVSYYAQCADAYQEYVEQERETLRWHLVTGSLGCKERPESW
jgi:hypothetical protein